jgi:hypothetical protein
VPEIKKFNKKSLQEVLGGIIGQLETQEIVEMSFVDFIEFIPTYSGGPELDTTDLQILAEAFQENGLISQPHVKGGFVERGIGSPIYIYMDQGVIDHDSGNYRYARLLVQTAVIVARLDRVIADEELTHIVRIISDLDFLSSKERIQLLAMASYFLKVSSAVGGGEQARAYLRVGLSKDLALQRMESLSSPARSALIEIMKDVVTSDGIIQKAEVGFLQDVYRSFGLPARSVKPDLEAYAQKHHIRLSREELRVVEVEILDEIDDVLGGLISDFDDF